MTRRSSIPYCGATMTHSVWCLPSPPYIWCKYTLKSDFYGTVKKPSIIYEKETRGGEEMDEWMSI